VWVDHNINDTLSAPALSLAVSSELDDDQLVVEAATQAFYAFQILHHWTAASLVPGVLPFTEKANRLTGSVQKHNYIIMTVLLKTNHLNTFLLRVTPVS
jgi:hypothetical protein